MWRKAKRFKATNFVTLILEFMLGILVELAISWLLLKLILKQNLEALGFMPNGRRLTELLAGLLWPVLYIALFQYSVSLLVHNPYHLNPNYNLKAFWNANAYVFRSVGYEDLIFRGALLYILIKKIGPQKAIWISAVAFGIYHWFSWGLFGNPVQMAIVFLMTGAGGYVFALAFEKTRSMYLPFALHFGIDMVNMVIFSNDKGMGKQLLLRTFEKDPVSPGSFISIIVLTINFIGFPLLTWLLLQKMKRHPLSVNDLPHR
jgi:uncharacterized protein